MITNLFNNGRIFISVCASRSRSRRLLCINENYSICSNKETLTLYHTYANFRTRLFESQLEKTYLRTCAPNEDSDQPAHSRGSESLLGHMSKSTFSHAAAYLMVLNYWWLNGQFFSKQSDIHT